MDALLQAQENGVVLGLNGVPEGGLVPRLDIDELLLHKPDTFNLFLLALSELQNDKNTSDKMGFYQVAGIHGLPRAFWDGVKSPNKQVDPQGRWAGEGYCAHSRPTFPTWHRPYLAMMEQTLYVKMADIAERYPEPVKPKYRAALKEFRLPYWDYYRPRHEGTTTMPGIVGPGGTTTFSYDMSVPQIFTVESVMIRRTQDDQLEQLVNPLNKFSFPTTGGLSTADWGLVPTSFPRAQTVRYPVNSTDARGDPTTMNTVINRERESNTTIILDMINDYDSFASFSSDSLTPGASGNLEDIHGNYHGLIGGRRRPQMGHMSIVPTAAFDPIFWMHHGQVDRWFAIWQAAHPTRWFDGQFTGDSGLPEDIAPLAKEVALPFRHPKGSYWDGNLSQDTKVFGYTYKDATGSAADVKKNFANLYTWAVRSRTGTGKYGTPPPTMAPLNVNEAQVFKYTTTHFLNNVVRNGILKAPQAVLGAVKATALATNETSGSSWVQKTENPADTAPVDTSPVAPGTKSSSVAFSNLQPDQAVENNRNVDESKYARDWYIDNLVERLALNGSFTIFYFIGKFNKDDVDHYELQPTLAGLNHVFTSSSEACDNCGNQAEEGRLISGTKPITPILLDYVKIGELPDITPANVVPFLIKNLKWRVVPIGGDLANPRSVAGFKVGVSSKLTPLSGTGGGPLYEEYPQIVEEIIANAS